MQVFNVKFLLNVKFNVYTYNNTLYFCVVINYL
nr:MAG TPA: hypothetical protein [Caudoviricetes sp.]